MDTLLNDLRFSIRLLLRNPLFALTAALSLAIGIAANTTVFTIANGMLLRAPAAIADPDRIVDIGRSQNGEGFDNNSYPNYLDVRARNTVFTDVYAFRFDAAPMSLGGANGAERIYGSMVTNNYFETLGVQPALGRLFTRDDREEAGAAPVVVLTHHFWTRRFRRDANIVGKPILINGHPFTVIGVAPEGFRGTTLFSADLWVPMSMVAEATPRRGEGMLTSREAVWLLMGGRLKPGITRERAQAELALIGKALEREYPQENRGRGIRVAALSPVPGNGAPIAAFLGGLMIVAALVLAIACANVAGVLLARATSRRREIAMRLALGAGRGRLIRQMLVESTTLFIAGGILGIGLARLMTNLLFSLLPALPVPIDITLSLDARVLLFTVALSLAAALLCGLVPAFNASKGNVVSSLKVDAGSAPERQRLRNLFVIAQVALSVVLVVGAGLFVRALQRAHRIDPGFDARNVELASLDLSLGGYTETTGPVFARELIAGVRAIRGVQSATLSAVLPLGMGGMGMGRLDLPGGPEDITADWNVVEPDYFATLRTPLLRGRDFDVRDREGAPSVAIVNETMARRLWPNQDAIGKVLTFERTRTLTVIGVARDAKYRSLGDEARMFIYVPMQQQYTPRVTIVARSNGQRIAPEIRALVASMNSNLPIVTSQTLDEFTKFGLVPQRVAASMSGGLGIVGLLLAAMGVYGVTAYMVTSRTREIGIRVALGAGRRDVLGMVLRRGMLLVGIGIAAGTLLAAAASRVLGSLLFGLPPTDPVTFSAAIALFCTIGLAACYVPARRATEIEPALALRSE
jgi:predicted permease